MNLLSKLHKNSILTGSVDSYCLVCNNYLRSEEDAYNHINKPIHKKNLDMVQQLEKYKEERIIKVKKGYYCMFCNLLLSTITKVSLHIADTGHRDNKGAGMLTRVGDSILAFDEVAISSTSWHGLIDNTCLICNIEFENQEQHETDKLHVLKLILTKCEFGERFIYRMVDEDSFFCLICSSVLSISEKSDHHENVYHKNSYDKGKEQSKNLAKEPVKDKSSNVTEGAIPKLNTKDSAPIASKKSNKGQANKDSDINQNLCVSKQLPVAGNNSDNKTLLDEKVNSTIKKTSETKSVKAGKKKDNSNKYVEDPTKTNWTEKDIPISSMADGHFGQSKPISTLSKIYNQAHKDNEEVYRCIICKQSLSETVILSHLKNSHQLNILENQKFILVKKIFEKVNVEDLMDDENTEGRSPAAVFKTEKEKQIQEAIAPLDQAKRTRTKLLDDMDTFQNQDITIDYFCDRVRCRRCNIELVFEYDAIKEHIDQIHVAATKAVKKNNNQVQTNDGLLVNALSNNTVKTADDKPNEHGQKEQSKSFTTRINEKALNPQHSDSGKAQDNKQSETGQIKTQNKASTSHKENDVEVQVKMAASQNQPKIKKANSESKSGKAVKKFVIPSINESIKGREDNKIEQNKPKTDTTLSKVPQEEFIKEVVYINSYVQKEMIINNKFLMTINSYMCTTDKSEPECFLCDISLGSNNKLIHYASASHMSMFLKVLVLTDMSDDFIRELQPDLFHCGICNHRERSMAKLIVHLQGPRHREAKINSLWVVEKFITNNKGFTYAGTTLLESILWEDN